MKEMFEEYGFDIIAALCCAVLFANVWAGMQPGGFIEKPFVKFIESIIGG